MSIKLLETQMTRRIVSAVISGQLHVLGAADQRPETLQLLSFGVHSHLSSTLQRVWRLKRSEKSVRIMFSAEIAH